MSRCPKSFAHLANANYATQQFLLRPMHTMDAYITCIYYRLLVFFPPASVYFLHLSDLWTACGEQTAKSNHCTLLCVLFLILRNVAFIATGSTVMRLLIQKGYWDRLASVWVIDTRITVHFIAHLYRNIPDLLMPKNMCRSIRQLKVSIMPCWEIIK